MAAAKKNTAGRKASAPKAKDWVVPIEATVTGYMIQKAITADDAVEAVDNILEEKKIDLLSGKALDLDDFSGMISRGEVSGALAMEDVVVPSKTARKRAPAKKATPKPKTTTTTARKGRSRGASDPSTGDKKKTPAKPKSKAKATTKKPAARKGRSRGSAKA